MKSALAPFNVGALMYVACALRDDEYQQMTLLGHTVDSTILSCGTAPGEKWVFMHGDTPLVVGGFTPTVPGVYRSWFLATKQAWEHYGRLVTAMTAERLNYIFENGARRVETLCLASRTDAQKWYETLGLVREATLRNYCTDGSDAALYVKLKG